jgi:hypothetical protein
MGNSVVPGMLPGGKTKNFLLRWLLSPYFLRFFSHLPIFSASYLPSFHARSGWYHKNPGNGIIRLNKIMKIPDKKLTVNGG